MLLRLNRTHTIGLGYLVAATVKDGLMAIRLADGTKVRMPMDDIDQDAREYLQRSILEHELREDLHAGVYDDVDEDDDVEWDDEEGDEFPPELDAERFPRELP